MILPSAATTHFALLTAAFVALALPPPAASQVLRTQEEALALAFGDSAQVSRHTLFLDEAQIKRIEKAAKCKLASKIVCYYAGVENDSVSGYAFFERNTVRTKDEIFMVVVNPDGTVRLVEMLAFYEPMDYFPTARWFKLFAGKLLDNELWPERGINGITGATLTVRAVTQGVRKVLAIYQEAVRSNKPAGQVQNTDGGEDNGDSVMKYMQNGGFQSHPLMRLTLYFTLFFLLGFWLTNFAMYFSKMSLAPESVESYYLGSEAEFRMPRTYQSMLEVSHAHLPMMAMVMLMLTHLMIFTPYQKVTKIAVISAAFAAAFLNESAGWLVRFIHPNFAWLKISMFSAFQGLLAWLLLSLAITLFRGRQRQMRQIAAEVDDASRNGDPQEATKRKAVL